MLLEPVAVKVTLWAEVWVPAAGLAVGAAITVPSTGQFKPVHREPVAAEAAVVDAETGVTVAADSPEEFKAEIL